MIRYLRFLSFVLIISCNCAIAQDYYREDSTIINLIKQFENSPVFQPNRTKPIDTNDILALGMLTVFINGGAIDKGNFHMHTEGYIKKAIEYSSHIVNTEVQDRILNKYMGVIKIDSVGDLIKLLKQTSWNKDKAK